MLVKSYLPGSEELRLESQQEYSTHTLSKLRSSLPLLFSSPEGRGQSEVSDLAEAAVTLVYVAWPKANPFFKTGPIASVHHQSLKWDESRQERPHVIQETAARDAGQWPRPLPAPPASAEDL